MAGNDNIAISVRGVSKCFEMYAKPVHRLYQTLFAGRRKFYKEFWALREIDFTVHRGECVGIIGQNGAGKSTLLQVITGTLQPTSGSVEINGRIAALLELGSGFNPDFTGHDNIYMNASILGLSREETDAKYDDIVRFADIGDFVDQPVKTYSSGMMVRLSFAVNAFVEPDILIVDEALAVGDIGFQMKCYQRLKRMRENGTTLLFVSHDLNTITEQCQKVIYLERGTVKEVSGNVPAVVNHFREDMRIHVINHSEQSSKNATNNSEQRFGSREATIEKIEFLRSLDDTSDQFVLSSGEHVFIRIVINSQKDIPACVFGIGLWSVSGLEVWGNNCLNDSPHGLHLRMGKNVFVFETAMHLNRGEYFLSAGIADITNAERIELDQRWGMKKMTFISSWIQPGFVASPMRLVKSGK